MAITNIKRDFGDAVCIVRIVSTDNLAAVGTAGYLALQAANIAAVNNGAFEWEENDFVLVSASNGWGFFEISSDLLNLVSFAFSNGVTLPTVVNDFAVFDSTSGNMADSGKSASDNSKTKVVMAGSAVQVNYLAKFVDTAGTVDDTAGAAINAGNLQAGLSGTAGSLISYPAGAALGSLSLVAANSAGNFAGVLTNASLAQATTWTFADPASAASRVLQAPAALVNGNLVKASGVAGLVADVGARIIANTTAAFAGGGVTNAYAAVGLTAASKGTAVIRASTNAVSICKALPGTDTLTITFSADPGTGTTVDYIYATAAI